MLSQREMTSETTPYNFYIRSILEQIWACSIQRAILRTTPSFFLFRTHWIWRNLVLKTPTSLPSSAVRAAPAPARDQRLYPDGRGHSALRLYPRAVRAVSAPVRDQRLYADGQGHSARQCTARPCVAGRLAKGCTVCFLGNQLTSNSVRYETVFF